MSDNPAKEVLGDLFSYLESLETKCAAMLAFLEGKGIATNEQLAPYLEQARDASSVKWRAARIRMEHLFTVAPEAEAKPSSSDLHETRAEGIVNPEKDKSPASDQDSSPEKTSAAAAKAATRQEAKESTEGESGQAVKNSPSSGGSDKGTSAKKPDQRDAQPDQPREKDAA